MESIAEKKKFNLELQAKARQMILDVQDKLCEHPDAVFGDTDLCPLKHSFADGQYVREMFIPKGVMIIGKIHKHSHPNFLLKCRHLACLIYSCFLQLHRWIHF